MRVGEYRGTKRHPYHISAGGVVWQKSGDDKIDVLLLHRFKSEHWHCDSWHLPKGTRHYGETLKQTAIQEIEEGTGYRVETGKRSVFSNRLMKRTEQLLTRKIIIIFASHLIRLGGGVTEHGGVRWVGILKAKKLLTDESAWEKRKK
jgi:ADP-ribose pyrophosphatase YjhB (NUDIX family)